MKTLAQSSDIYREKKNFFINRLVTYFSFLVLPVFVQEYVPLNLLGQSAVLCMYMLFMGGQWYLLGREVDHRLKIYYRVNSSLERVLYRLVLGNTILTLLFNLIFLIPSSVQLYVFWSFFAIVGLFYSWPTRGKIIEETMSRQFSEFRYLDSFEKTVISITLIMFIFSFPEIPLFQNTDALKLFFDPQESVHVLIWNFLTINFLPFSSHARLFNLTWSYYLYFYGLGVFLLAFYALMRYFISRRLAILGLFAITSAWPFAKLVESNFINVYVSTYGLVWVWSVLWAIKSSTYRSGLFYSIVCVVGTWIDAKFILLLPLGSLIVFFALTDHTFWYRKQWLKYSIAGTLLALVSLVGHSEQYIFFNGHDLVAFRKGLSNVYTNKAFFSLAWFGLAMLIVKRWSFFKGRVSHVLLDQKAIGYFLLLFLILFIFSFLIDKNFFNAYAWLAPLTFLSLLPLEWIFQSIHKMRSRRNIIYVVYFLACLMDSRFEGRVRTIGKLFFDQEILKYIHQL